MSQASQTTPHTVLFVCTGNYYRSRYAELFFNAIRPTTLGWRAASRGFDPSPFNSGPIAAGVLARITSHGLKAPTELAFPRRLSEDDLRNANRIIALDAREHPPYVADAFPSWRERFDYWHVPDLDRMSADEAFGLIEFNVETLLRELHAV